MKLKVKLYIICKNLYLSISQSMSDYGDRDVVSIVQVFNYSRPQFA